MTSIPKQPYSVPTWQGANIGIYNEKNKDLKESFRTFHKDSPKNYLLLNQSGDSNKGGLVTYSKTDGFIRNTLMLDETKTLSGSGRPVYKYVDNGDGKGAQRITAGWQTQDPNTGKYIFQKEPIDANGVRINGDLVTVNTLSDLI